MDGMEKTMKIMKRLAAAAIIAMIILIMAGADRTEAKSRHPWNGIFYDSATGDSYIYKHGRKQYGWAHYKGNWYYAHKKAGNGFSKGSICKDTYRVRGHRMYFFGRDGKRLKKDTGYIVLNKCSKSVHYIKIPGDPNMRFNANHRRYQRRNKGKWEDVGMQVWPYGLIDWME